jgi:hypothetical protein
LIVVAVLTQLWSHAVWSGYTANVGSTVKWVKIYNSDTIYFELHTHPTTACTIDNFVLNPSLTSEQRQRYYALLLTARATGQPVSVGYGEQPVDCYNDRALVYAMSLTE